MGAALLDQLRLKTTALVAGLAEAGGDHDERAHLLLGAFLHDAEDEIRRHRDEREIDRPFDVLHTRVRANALNRRALRIHGIDDSGERLAEQVLQEPAADARRVA